MNKIIFVFILSKLNKTNFLFFKFECLGCMIFQAEFLKCYVGNSSSGKKLTTCPTGVNSCAVIFIKKIYYKNLCFLEKKRKR